MSVNVCPAAFTPEIDFPGFGCGPVQRAPDSLEDALAPVLAAHGAPALLVNTRGSSILEPRVYASGIDPLRRLSPSLVGRVSVEPRAIARYLRIEGRLIQNLRFTLLHQGRLVFL